MKKPFNDVYIESLISSYDFFMGNRPWESILQVFLFQFCFRGFVLILTFQGAQLVTWGENFIETKLILAEFHKI